MMGFLSLGLFYFSLMTFSGPCVIQRIKIQVKNVLSSTALKLYPVAFITSNNMKYSIYILFSQSGVSDYILRLPVLGIYPTFQKDPYRESFRITLPCYHTNYFSAK